MLSGTNLEYTRSYNQRVVLEAIRLFEPVSRAEIARHTGLTIQTVSNIVGELVERGVVEASSRRFGRRGQPALEITLNPEGAFSIGLHLDRDHFTGVLVDLRGQVHQQMHHELDFPTPDEALPLLRRSVQHLIAARALQPERLWGIGLGLPGPIEAETGKLVAPPNFPGWDGISVAEALTQEPGLPVYVENDATAAAIGERWYGAGRLMNHFFYVYFGVGLGGGLVLNGHPYRGHWGNAAEFGHVPVEPGGRPCPCGGVGCLEQYVSMAALYKAMHQEGLAVRRPEDLEALFREKNPALLRWLEEAARYLVPALVAVENLLNPEAIFFGGRLPGPLLDYLLEQLAKLLPSRRMRGLPHHPRLERAQATGDAACLGAATLPFYETIAPSHHLLLKKIGAP
jgi:predicted NBD/HSP70 family sugar kinase